MPASVVPVSTGDLVLLTALVGSVITSCSFVLELNVRGRLKVVSPHLD